MTSPASDNISTLYKVPSFQINSMKIGQRGWLCNCIVYIQTDRQRKCRTVEGQ